MAVERIFSQGVIADLLKDPENLELMSVCFSRMSDRRIIESIAQDEAYGGVVRRMAVEYFADSGYLDEVAEASQASEMVEPSADQRVEAFVELYGGGLRGVRAIGRFRRSEKALKALGTIARQGGETGGLAIEYLCSALASANPKSGRMCCGRTRGSQGYRLGGQLDPRDGQSQPARAGSPGASQDWHARGRCSPRQ